MAERPRWFFLVSMLTVRKTTSVFGLRLRNRAKSRNERAVASTSCFLLRCRGLCVFVSGLGAPDHLRLLPRRTHDAQARSERRPHWRPPLSHPLMRALREAQPLRAASLAPCRGANVLAASNSPRSPRREHGLEPVARGRERRDLVARCSHLGGTRVVRGREHCNLVVRCSRLGGARLAHHELGLELVARGLEHCDLVVRRGRFGGG